MKITKEGKEVSYDSLEQCLADNSVQQLFNSTGRDERNKLFGKYLADTDTIDLASLSEKVKKEKESYKGYIANLDILAEAIQKELKNKKAEELMASVSSMTPEQLQALKDVMAKVESDNMNK